MRSHALRARLTWAAAVPLAATGAGTMRRRWGRSISHGGHNPALHSANAPSPPHRPTWAAAVWAALLALGAGRWGLGRVVAATAGLWTVATARQLLRQPLAVPNTGHRAGAHGFAGARVRYLACRHACCQQPRSCKAANPVLEPPQGGIWLGVNPQQQSGPAMAATAFEQTACWRAGGSLIALLRDVSHHRHCTLDAEPRRALGGLGWALRPAAEAGKQCENTVEALADLAARDRAGRAAGLAYIEVDVHVRPQSPSLCPTWGAHGAAAHIRPRVW